MKSALPLCHQASRWQYSMLQVMQLVSLLQIDTYFEKDLMRSLEIYRGSSPEGNQTIRADFDAVQHLVNQLLTLSTGTFLLYFLVLLPCPFHARCPLQWAEVFDF